MFLKKVSGNVTFPHDHEWKDGRRGKKHLPPSPEYEFSLRSIAGVALFAVSIIGVGVLSMDDMTGIGIADDFLVGPVSAGVSQGILMIFG